MKTPSPKCSMLLLLVVTCLMPLSLNGQAANQKKTNGLKNYFETTVNGYRVAHGQRPPIDLSQLSPEAFETGRIRVKMTPLAQQRMQGMKFAATQGGYAQTGMAAIDQLNEAYGVSGYRPILEEFAAKSASHNNQRNRHQAWGFHLWYELEIDSKSDIVKAVKQFAALKEVEHAEPVFAKRMIGNVGSSPTKGNQTIGITWVPDDPQFDMQWHYLNTGQNDGTKGKDINVVEAWEMERGHPDVVVAIIDEGIQFDHPDLSANMWSGLGYDFANNSPNITPGDHGTHVAGTVAAVNNNGVGVSGVAGGSGTGDGIRLMSCQVFSGWSSGGFELAPIYAADNGAAISQNSWGYTSPGVYEELVLDAIDYFNANGGGTVLNGGITIFASGNDDSSEAYYPGYYQGTLSVAATNNNDEKAWYSNYGSWVDISAPGGETNLSYTRGVLSSVIGNNYDFYQGTSMACPHVSGVAALLVSYAHRNGVKIDNTELWDLLVENSDDHYAENPDFIDQLGFGRLNANSSLIAIDEMLTGLRRPANLSATPVSTTQIDLSWGKNDEGNDVMIVWSADGHFGVPVDGENLEVGDVLAEGGEVLYMGSGTAFSHNELEPSTEYFYRAFSFNPEDQYSWGQNVSAYTLCDAQPLPFFESFESSTSIPLCWSLVDADGDKKNWGIGGTAYIPQDGSLVAVSASTDRISGDLTPDNWLVFPQLLMSANNVLLKFYVKAQNASKPNEKFSVMVSNGSSAMEDYTEVYAETLQNANWKQVVVQLNGYLDEEVHVAIRHWGCTGQSQLVIDNISVEEYEIRNLTLAVNPENTGSVSGAGAYYNGQVVTVSATANSGYIFENWMLNEEVVSTDASYDFTIPTHDVILKANFTDKIPALTITPESIDEMLYRGNSVTRLIALSNTGDEGSTLNVAIDYTDIISQGRLISQPALVYGLPKSNETYYKGSNATKASNTLMPTTAPLSTGASVLYLTSKGGMDIEFSTALQNLENIESYAELDVINNTPNVDYLIDYDIVVVSSGSWFSNAELLGNNLADYVDAGGRVCLLPGSFFLGGGFTLEGRIMTEDYSPLSVAEYSYITSQSTTFIDHPITSNVNEVGTVYWSYSIVQGAGMSLGTLDSGSPVAAYNAEKPVVALNIDVYDGSWSGDLMQMVQNTIDWLIESKWLQLSPAVVSIPSGESYEFEITLNAASLVEGVYESGVRVNSNDPEKPIVDIPVTLEVQYERFPLAISANPTDGGVVAGDGNYYENEKVMLEATANEGFMFVNWTLNEELISTAGSFEFTMPAHELSLVANFTDQIPEITVDPISLSENIFSGHTLTDLLTISNTALGNLTYEIEIIDIDRGEGSIDASQDLIEARPNYEKGAAIPDIYSESPMTSGGGPDEYGYFWSVSSINWMDATSGTSLSLGDDSWASAIPIGFEFDYYGQIFSEINIMSNGWVSFSTSNGWFPSCVPGSGYGGAIVPFGIDLDPRSGGNIYYQTQGNAPNRRFIIEFNDIRTYGSSEIQTFQVVFYERTGVILFQYLETTAAPSTIGIESPSGGTGLGNCASGDLFINPNIVENNLAIKFSPLNSSWLSLSTYSGAVISDEERLIDVTYDANNLAEGVYESILRITSNDPVSPVTNIPVSLTVEYERFALTVLADPLEGGVVTGDGNYYENEKVPLEATPNEGFMFVNWKLNEELVSTSPGFEYTMPANEVSLVANFTDQVPEITVEPIFFNVDLFSGQTSTEILTIKNTGLGNLPYGIEIVDVDMEAGSINAPQPLIEARPKHEKGAIIPDIYSESPMTLGGGPDEFGYFWSVLPIDWMDATSGTSITLGDDSWASAIPIGFEFDYYGQSFSEINIMSNGWVSFSTYDGWFPSCVPGSDYGGAIVPFGRDLDPRSGGNIYYQTQGMAPNRRFVIEFNNIMLYGSSLAQTFQVVFHERTGSILFQYLNAPQAPSSIGIESPSGISGMGNCASGDLFINPNIVANNLAIKFSPINSNWLSLSSFSGSVLSEEEGQIEVTFDATELPGGVYESMLRISSIDPETPVVNVPISLNVTGASICSVSHSKVEFDDVAIGTSYEFSLTISNSGTDNLLINNILSSDTHFEASSSDLVVPINEMVELIITFYSMEQGAFEGILTFETNAPSSPHISIALSAQASMPSSIEVNPGSFHVTLGYNESVEKVLTITNSGGILLGYSTSTFLDIEIDQERKFTNSIDLGTKTFEGANNLGGQPLSRNEFIRYNKGTKGGTNFNILIYEEVATNYWYLEALNALELDYTYVSSWEALEIAMNGVTQWNLVLVNSYNYGSSSTAINALANYVNGGGKLIFAHWKRSDFSDHSLSQIMGINVVSDIVTPTNLSLTSSASVLSSPNVLPDEYIWKTNQYPVDGQIVEAVGGAERLAIFDGYPNSAAIVLNAEKNSIFNAFQSDNYSGDDSGSGKPDIRELLENQISYLLLKNLVITPPWGTVPKGESTDLTLKLSSEGLSRGIYHGNVILVSNDPLNPEVIVPVTLEVNTSTGNEDHSMVTVKVFPNPFSTSVTVSSAYEVSRVIITNMIGLHLVEVESSSSESIEIPTGQLAEGVYLITLYKQNGDAEVFKMVKRR